MSAKRMLEIDTHPSHLELGEDGQLRVRLVQMKAGRAVLGQRHALLEAQLLLTTDESSSAHFERCLKKTESKELAIISFHPGVSGCHDKIAAASNDRTIVTLGGIDVLNGGDTPKRNLVLIGNGGKVVAQEKISLSSEDRANNVQPGDTLNIFESAKPSTFVRWAVLNCHDYSHVDLLNVLLTKQIELVVVVTYNNATRLYWEYATSDVHRLYCNIVIVNVAELGGSGVFVPFRRIGEEKNAQFAAGGQIFGTRGPAETTVTLDLDIAELRLLRERNVAVGLSNSKNLGSSRYAPVLPPEHFIKTFDRGAGPPPITNIETVQLDWNSDDPLVAIAQLSSMSIEAYIECDYRLRRHPEAGPFEAGLVERLTALEQQVTRKRKKGGLDFLLFPEVFLAREFVNEYIVPFAMKAGVIALCGVDYPGCDEKENRNSCLIIGPDGVVTSYDKITRSQYDAVGQNGRKGLCRGDRLVRFQNKKGHAFGVLICYDFSHIDLVSRLNLEERDEPLDIIFIIAHNPYSSLYRACCIADSHRFYQHIVMCNVAQYGGSGVFAPKRTNGARQVLLDMGVNTEAIALVELDISGQRKARLLDDNNLHSDEWMRKSGIFQRRIS